MSVIIVTGAAGVLGGAVAELLVRQGKPVVGLDRVEAAGPAGLAEMVPGVDLADEAAVAEVFQKIGASHGEIRGLANVAGGFLWEPVVDGSVDSFRRMFEMNLVTSLVASRAAAKEMPRGGSIVNLGAAAADRAATGMAAYAAAKAGVARLTESLSEELKDQGIRVNAVLPAIIDTPTNRRDMPEADFTRWASPGEVASVIAFLLSDAASGVTGAAIRVTGRI